MSTSDRHYRWFLFAAWAMALAGAFAVDRPVARWVHDAVPIDKHLRATHRIIEIVKLPGWFPVTLGIAGALGLCHPRRWLAAMPLAVSGIAVGELEYSILKWIAGRHRPVSGYGIAPFSFHPFVGGIPGIWREKALCFPSGHASLSFASAICLAMLLPRWRWAFFAVATITAAERVLENAHYLSDVVAGAGLGTLAGWIITRWLLAFDPMSLLDCGCDAPEPYCRPTKK